MITENEISLEEQERLVNALKRLPNRQWVSDYLDLVKDLLIFTNLKEDDPRLVLSIPKNLSRTRLSVIVNSRLVAAALPGDVPTYGFLFKPEYSQQIQDKAVQVWYYGDKVNHGQVDPPNFLRFETVLEIKGWKEQWQEAVCEEVGRGTRSPYRPYHNSMLYRAVFDLDYRKEVLDEVYLPEGMSLLELIQYIDEKEASKNSAKFIGQPKVWQ